jgi:hypothetical protein
LLTHLNSTLATRVLNISHTSTFDGRVVERLFADLDSQMSLVATAIKTSTDDRSLGELSAFKIILRDAENQVRSSRLYALMLKNNLLTPHNS